MSTHRRRALTAIVVGVAGIGVGAAMLPAAAQARAGRDDSLHLPALVVSSRAAAHPTYLVAVTPAGSAARIASGCSVFSISAFCAEVHAVAAVLWATSTLDASQAEQDAEKIVEAVANGSITTTLQLATYLVQGVDITFHGTEAVIQAAIDKIAAILHLNPNAAAPTAAPAPVPAPVAPTTVPTPTDPVTPVTPAPPITPSPVVAPLPVVSGTGTVSIVPIAPPGTAQVAAVAPLATVRVRLAGLGGSSVVPVSWRASRRLAAMARRHGRVRLVQRLTYRVHRPGSTAADLTFTAATTRAVRLRPR